MAVHSVFMNNISHNVHLCSFTAMPSAPIRQTYKSKSSAPFGLRSPDTSHRWSRAVKYAHERCPFAVPRAPAEPIVRHGKCIYKFHNYWLYASPFTRQSCATGRCPSTADHVFTASWDKDTARAFLFFFFSDVNFTSQKRCISQLAVALRKSKSNTRQTNGQINHPYWISSSCCDYLHVLFFFVLCRRFCVTPWGSIASNDRALWVDLGCIRSAMEKIPPTLPVSHSANTCLHNSK